MAAGKTALRRMELGRILVYLPGAEVMPPWQGQAPVVLVNAQADARAVKQSRPHGYNTGAAKLSGRGCVSRTSRRSAPATNNQFTGGCRSPVDVALHDVTQMLEADSRNSNTTKRTAALWSEKLWHTGKTVIAGVAQSGRAMVFQTTGRRFKSCRPLHLFSTFYLTIT